MMKKIKLAKVALMSSLLALPAVAGAQWSPQDLASDADLPDTPLNILVANIISWGAFFLGGLGVLGFLVSGIFYVTSFGNEDRMELGKTGMKYSIMGVAIGLLGYIAVLAIREITDDVKPY